MNTANLVVFLFFLFSAVRSFFFSKNACKHGKWVPTATLMGNNEEDGNHAQCVSIDFQ